MRRILREPLVYFLLAGGALFFVADLLRGDGTDRTIVIDSLERQRLIDQWQSQMGRPPSERELAGLIEQWIREEIYYREALALNLDRDDIIIRRRLAQKLAFLTEDLATASPAEDADLEAYYRANIDRYTEPERFTFSHRYFSSQRHADAQAAARAALEIARGRPADAADLPGDPFMLQRAYAARSEREIAELFGRDFAASLASLETGAWNGPVQSAYGWHIVYVDARLPAEQLPFQTVRERVGNDLQQRRRSEANEAFYQSLRARYEIRDDAGP
ncbi:MAG: peptidylprolyl isomerase [Pseudomonadales bacterium]